MLDFSNILINPKADIQFFETGSTAGLSSQEQIWIKPRNKKFAQIICIGAGGGGGGGFRGLTGNPNGSSGGGGGGSGAVSVALFNLFFLPDKLFVSVGLGGAGASGNTGPGTAGSLSCVKLFTGTDSNYILMQSNGGSGGGAAAADTGGAGGAGGAASAINTAFPSGLGFHFLALQNSITNISVAGQTGTAGGPSAGTAQPGVNLTLPTTGIFVTGGTGGGGLGATGATGGKGGSFNGLPSGIFPLHDGGLPGVQSVNNAGQVGSNGIKVPNLFYFFGGTGGGGAGTSTTPGVAAAGGAGGAGAYGCGGGGGGAGYVGSTGSAGGRGGNGLVVIASW